jgi:hypothetical protein
MDMAIICTLLGNIVDEVNMNKVDMGKKCHGQWRRIWCQRGMGGDHVIIMAVVDVPALDMNKGDL